MDRLLDTLATQSPLLVGLLLLVLLAGEGTAVVGLFVPGDAVILMAGSALGSPVEVAGVWLAGVAGCLLGASCGYLLGARYGERVRHSRLGRRIGERHWRRADRLVGASGVVIAMAYFLPVVNALIPVLAGTLGLPYGRFMRAATGGGCAWVAFYLAVGAVAGSTARQHEALLLPLTAGVAILVAGVTLATKRALRGHLSQRPRAGSPR